MSLLFDLTEFKWEKVNAWGNDRDFGKQFKDKIDKMAIVGDKKWGRHLAKLAQPFDAKESKYFVADDDAWDWLQDGTADLDELAAFFTTALNGVAVCVRAEAPPEQVRAASEVRQGALEPAHICNRF